MRLSKRGLLWGTVVLVLLGAGLWLGLNLWLDTQSFSRLVNRKPDHLLIEWSDAKMLVPGRLVVRGLRIRGNQRRVQWYAELEQATVSFDLWALTNKTFRTESVVGEGLRVLLRQRLRDGVDEAHAEYYPDIPGLPMERAEPRPEGPRRPPGWRIEVGGLDIRQVTEFWFNEYRLRGNGALSGEVDLQVRGPVNVDDATLSWTEGHLALAGDDMAGDLVLDARADIESFVPREAKGTKFFKYLVGRLKLEGDVENVDFLQYYLQHAGGLEVDARGHLSCDLGLNRGRIEPGSTLMLDAPRLATSFPSLGFDGRGTIEASVSEPSDGEPAVSEVRLALRELEAHGLSDSPLTARTGIDVVVRSRDPDLTTERRDPEVILELPDLQLPDLRSFNALIPEGLGLSFVEGQAEVVANLDLTRTEGSSALQVRGDGIVVDFKGQHLAGGLDLDVLYAGGLKPTQLSIDGTWLAFGPPTTGADGAEDAGRWAELTFKQAELQLTRDVPDQGQHGKRHNLAPADGILTMEGRIADLGLLNEYLSYGKWLGLHGEVDLDASVHMDGRSIQDGSLIELQADHLLARFMGWEVGGQAKIAGENQPEGHAELRVDFDEVEIARDGKGHFRGPEVRLRAWGPDLSGGVGLNGLSVRVDVEEAEALDASLLNDYLPHPELVSLSSGNLALGGYAELAERAGDARLDLTAQGVEARLRGEPFTTDMTLELDMRSPDPTSRRFSVGGSRLRFDETRWGGAGDEEARDGNWTGQFEILEGEIELGHPPTIDGSIELTLQDTRPLMHALFSKSNAAQWFEAWLVLQDVDGTAKVHFGADGIRLDDLKLSSDLTKLDGSVHMAPPKPGEKGHAEEVNARGELIKPLTIEFEALNDLLHSHVISFSSGMGELLGHVEMGGDAASGQLVLTGQDLGMLLWGETLATDLSIDIEMNSDDMHSHRFDVSDSSVRLDNGHWLGDEFAEHHPGWWAELQLSEAQVVLGKPLTIDTNIELRVRDTHPLIYLAGTKSKALHWFHRFLEIKEVDGTMRLHLGPDGIRLEDLDIEGKGLKIEGRIELSKDREYLLLHVVLHHLSAALEIRDGKHHMSLIGAKHWYERRLHGSPEGAQ